MGFIFWLWLIGIIFYSFRSLTRHQRQTRRSIFENYDSQAENQTVQQEHPVDDAWPDETHLIDTIQDPVCGAYITEETAIQRRIQGTIRYFCCEACAERFEKSLRNAI